MLLTSRAAFACVPSVPCILYADVAVIDGRGGVRLRERFSQPWMLVSQGRFRMDELDDR
jgi:hypothetical protein